MDNSIFDKEVWKKYLPKKLNVVTNNGNFELVFSDIAIVGTLNKAQIMYYQNTVEGPGTETKDGEPDTLEFDITLVKDNKGDEANPSNSLRLNVDLTYGDSMMYAFTIDYPNKVNVHHYNGKDSLYDAGTFFGFSDESLQELVTFFNRFGFTTTVDDFKFIDDDPDSYDYERPTEKYLKDPQTTGNKLIPMIMDDEMKSEVDDLKGGDRIKRYEEFKKDKEV